MKKLLSLNLILVALLAIGHTADAQSDLQNNGTLYVSGSSDILYITGNFTNASGAALTNNGSLYVKLGLSNAQAGMATGTGTLYLNGTSAQSISGAQAFKTLHFVSNNSAGITLNNDLSVSGIHTFTAGIITSSATPNYLIYEAGASYSGDGDAQHVNGWVRKNGATNFVFPVGNNTVERAIGISSLSGSSTFNAQYAGATTNVSNVATPLVTVDPYEYWHLNLISGGTAQVVMNWDKSKINFPPYSLAGVRVANYSAGNWTNAGGSASGNVATTGNISSSSTGSFGAFTFGSNLVALPVDLLDFGAKRMTGYNLVSWTTTNEANVNDYVVQRSDDGRIFYVAGTVAARNVTGVQHYELDDIKPMNNTAYYRLQSVDIDGQYKLSTIVTVNDMASAGNYFVVANPVHAMLNVSAGNMHSGDYQYHIMTVNGQTVQAGRLSMSNGGSYHVALSPSIVRGVYVVEFRNEGFSYRQQVLVQ